MGFNSLQLLNFVEEGWHLLTIVFLSLDVTVISMPCSIFCLQYLSQCDIVLYMKNGKIAERGTCDELIRNNGVNSSIFFSANKYYSVFTFICAVFVAIFL